MAESTGQVGYSIEEGKKLQHSIDDAFNSVKEKISSPWSELQATLRAEWVGEDEFSYEKEFVKKINSLYGSAKWVSDACIATIQTLLEGWAKFQDSNLIEGATNEGDTLSAVTANCDFFNLESMPSEESYKSLTAIDEPAALVLSNDTVRGLTNGASSAGKIQDAVSTYVNAVHTGVNELFSSFNANSAFFGDQVESINNLKNNCSTAIAEVVTAVQDLNDLLEELAGSRYTGGSDSMDFSASVAASESNGTISSSVNSMESKWHG